MATPKMYRKLSTFLWDKGTWLFAALILNSTLCWFLINRKSYGGLITLSFLGCFFIFLLIFSGLVFRILSEESKLSWPAAIVFDFWFFGLFYAASGFTF
jgi:hypothetical protein